MAKRSPTSAFSPSGMFNMVKRLRFSKGDLDFYLAEPEEIFSSSSASLKNGGTDETTKATRADDFMEEAQDEQQPPRLIQYREGFPKLLFHDLQSDDPKVVLETTTVLDEMLSGKEASRDKIQKEFLMLGGHGVLITTMQKWTNHGMIQSNLCRCISGLIETYNGSTATASNDEEDGGSTTATTRFDLVSSLLLMGALDQITSGALMQFPQYPDIQLDAMLAVTQLCGGGGTVVSDDDDDDDGYFQVSASSKEATKRFVGELRGVSWIAKTMTVYAGIQELQECGCRLLNILCRAGDHDEAAIMKKYALVVAAASVQSYPDNTNIGKDVNDFMDAVLSGKKNDDVDLD